VRVSAQSIVLGQALLTYFLSYSIITLSNERQEDYMKLDIKMYKVKVINGKEEIAKEWLDFLNKNRDEGIKTLQNEKVYLESYFFSKEVDATYVYLHLVADNIDYANNTALKSDNAIDLKHFDYMKKCLDQTSGVIMECSCYMDNLSNINNL
jgi:hypothetical protein